MHDLSRRASSAREIMDDPNADPAALSRTYERFALVNAVVGGWRRVYRRELRPRARARGGRLRVLDIGCGGADVGRRLLRLARRDGVALSVLGLDPDARAIAWARGRPPETGLELRHGSSSDIEDARFDVVLSHHVLHHLGEGELDALLADSLRLLSPGGLVLHADLARSRTAYEAFRAATLPMQPVILAGSFIRPDGLTSIRRSYTAGELASLVPPGWSVRRAFPARLQLRWEDG